MFAKRSEALTPRPPLPNFGEGEQCTLALAFFSQVWAQRKRSKNDSPSPRLFWERGPGGEGRRQSMTQTTEILLMLIGAYLLGSLPFGYWVALKVKGVDIRTVGSGNIGSTNVSRICGPVAGAVVWFLDVLKGLTPPLVAAHFGFHSAYQILAAFCAIFGHNYSLFLGFKGGKGISTSLGALLGSAPPVGAAVALIWVAFVLTLRYVSLASIAAALSLLVFMPLAYPGDTPRLIFASVACFMAVYKHRANIQRLRDGREPKINLPWTKKPAQAVALQTEIETAETAVETEDIKKENSVNAPR